MSPPSDSQSATSGLMELPADGQGAASADADHVHLAAAVVDAQLKQLPVPEPSSIGGDALALGVPVGVPAASPGPAFQPDAGGPSDTGAPARAALDTLAKEIFPYDEGPAVAVPLDGSKPAAVAAPVSARPDRAGRSRAPARGIASRVRPAHPAPAPVPVPVPPGAGSHQAPPGKPPKGPSAAPDPESSPAPSRHGAHSAKARCKTRFVYPQRRWPRRVLVLANLMVGLTLLMAASAYAYANWRVSQIRRVVLPSLVGGKQAPTSAGASIPVAPAGAPMTILVVGSDSRAGDTGSDAAQFGSSADVGGQRSDTIMLVHLVPATGQAAILSIPRDLWVPIPGQGDSRINSAFDSGPDLLVKTIETDLDIPIDHYVEIDFQSFRDIVNAVGGVEQYFPTAAKDAYSLLNIPAAGCYNMTGDMALSFVRARHYEYQVDGEWIYEAESDLARIERQQSFVKKMITKAEGENITNIGAINGIIGGITTNLTLDSGFSQSLLLSLAEHYRGLDPSSMPTSTLSTYPTVIGGGDVLLLQQPDAAQQIDAFLHPAPPPAAPQAHGPKSTSSPSTTTSTTVPSIPPSSIQVAVQNGSGRSGEATSAANALSGQGFVVTSVGSASSFTYTTPEVLYGPGDLDKAQTVANAVEGGATLQSDPTLQGADVELITGQSYQGIATVPGATSNPTTASPTTMPSTTTTTIYQLPGTPQGSTPPSCP